MWTICRLLICPVRHVSLIRIFSYSARLGVIQSVREGGREADIQEVKNLVSAFIKKPSCLILLVVSCESWFSSFLHSCRFIDLQPADIENQGARQLAKQVDPSGERTIRTTFII